MKKSTLAKNEACRSWGLVSSPGGSGESFPKWYSLILRKGEHKEEDGLVKGTGKESCGAEVWFRVEKMVCVKAPDQKGSDGAGHDRKPHRTRECCHM